MKKFSKLVAVVLAIAVIICPMMSVVSHATTTGGYKIEAIDANNLKLTINSTDGFIAYHATVGFNSNDAFQSSYTDATTGYKNGLKVISYTLKTAEENPNNKPAISAEASGKSLTVIVMPSDINNLDLCTEIVIGIRVADGTTASLTKIQAADNGADVTADPTLLSFPAAGSDGVIDSTAQDYIASNATTNAHTHAFTQQSTESTYLRTAATCTADATYWYSCATCGLASSTEYFTATGTKIAHTPDNTETALKQAATCTTNALYYQECSVCHTQLETYWEKPNTALGHNMTFHAATSSTCKVQGNIEYYYCSRCEKFFADENGAHELTAEQIKRDLAAHTPATAVKENEVAATCTEGGHYDTVVYCTECGAEISRETTNLEPNGHTPVTDEAVAATCTETGLTAGSHCSVCGAVITAQTVVPALGHDFVTYTSNGKGSHTATCTRCDATDTQDCNTNGNDGACSVCGYKAAPAEIPVDSNIVCVSGGGLGTSAYISFYFTKASLSADYKSFEFMVTRNVSGAGYMFTNVTEEVTDTATTSTRLYYYVRGIELYAMSIPITGVLYCKDANGNVIAKSQEFTTTLADSLYAMYTKSTNAKQRRALADVIIAGAEAQRFVTASASDSDLGKMVLPTEGKVLEDASDSLEEMAAYNINNSAAPYTIGVGGGIGASPYLTFNFSGISNPDNYYVKLSYYNAIEGTEKEKIVYLNDTNTDIVKKSGTKYYVYYKEMAIPATNAAVTAELYQIGESEPISSYTYCLDAFFESRKTNSAMGTLVVALAKLGQSFRAFNAK